MMARALSAVLAFAAVAAWRAPASAHCDTLDGPVVLAARKALDTGNVNLVETGKLQPLGKLIAERMEKGLHGHFDAVMAKKKHQPNGVEAGRAYASAYVEFVH